MDVFTSSVLNYEIFITHPRTRVQKHKAGGTDEHCIGYQLPTTASLNSLNMELKS